MSIHKSLALGSKLRRHRNVLTRSERFEQLLKEGKITEERSVFGLPKVRSIMTKAKAKVKKEEVAAEAGAAPAAAAGTAPAAGAAAPAAGAKGAAPAAGTAKPAADKNEKKK